MLHHFLSGSLKSPPMSHDYRNAPQVCQSSRMKGRWSETCGRPWWRHATTSTTLGTDQARRQHELIDPPELCENTPLFVGLTASYWSINKCWSVAGYYINTQLLKTRFRFLHNVKNMDISPLWEKVELSEGFGFYSAENNMRLSKVWLENI